MNKQSANTSMISFSFGRKNYILMIIGLVLIILGFVLMSGGGSEDPNVFSDAIFNFRRLTLAPIMIMLGYMIEIAAIFYKDKSVEEEKAE